MMHPQYILMHWVLQEEGGGNGGKGGHRKGKLIRKQPAKKRRKGMPKKKMATPAILLVRKTDPTQARWTTVPGTMFNGWPEVSSYRQDSRTFEGSEGSKIQTGLQNQDHGLDRRTSHGLSQHQNERMAGASPEVRPRNDGFKRNPTLPKVHGISHQKASIQEVGQGDRSQSSTRNEVPILGAASAPGGC